MYHPSAKMRESRNRNGGVYILETTASLPSTTGNEETKFPPYMKSEGRCAGIYVTKNFMLDTCDWDYFLTIPTYGNPRKYSSSLVATGLS